VPSYGIVHLLDLRDEQLEIIEVEVPTARRPRPARSARSTCPRAPDHLDPARGGGFVPKADTVIEAGDEVLLVLDPGPRGPITEQFASNRRDAA
jgi:trk system potassium uptake protein TrkA